jgi:hypothetical protein
MTDTNDLTTEEAAAIAAAWLRERRARHDAETAATQAKQDEIDRLDALAEANRQAGADPANDDAYDPVTRVGGYA